MGRRNIYKPSATGKLSRKQIKLLYEADDGGFVVDLLAKRRHKGTSSATVNALTAKGMIRCVTEGEQMFAVREYHITQKGRAALEADMREEDKAEMLRNIEIEADY